LYTANLDGSNMKLLLSDSWRQLSHARVSPDKKWITFIRYNNVGKDGCAFPSPGNFPTEGEAYLETEIMLMKADGSGLRAVAPSEKGMFYVNSHWSPESSREMVYMCGPYNGLGKICRVKFDESMEVEETSFIPLRKELYPVDPDWGKDTSGDDRIIFPAVDLSDKTTGIYWVRLDGSGLEKLSYPPIRDNDPHLSPDGTKVAVMRQVNKALNWHITVIDVETKEAKDLSEDAFPKNTIVELEGVPEWSSDGRLLIFWHKYAKIGKQEHVLHTIQPDGTGRKKVHLPEEYKYSTASFFPEGSDDSTRIVFSAHKDKK